MLLSTTDGLQHAYIGRLKLMVPRHRCSTFGRRSFFVTGPMEWNLLPHSLRGSARSTDGFRSALKTYLFAAQMDD